MNESASDPAALYHLDGRVLVPTELTQGPWDPTAQHGGALAALAVRCLEAVAQPAPMRLARLTVDLLRGVPLAPLAVETQVVRQGKRLQLVDLKVLHEGRPVARSAGLFIRSAQVPGVEALPAPRASTTPDDGVPPDPGMRLPGYIRALEFRSQGIRERGAWSSSAWCRLRVPVVAGEIPSPCARLAAAADFASGIANPIDLERYVAINPDLTIAVEREPRSEWIGIEGETRMCGDGMGHSLGAVFDLEGRVARVQASLFVDERSKIGG
jgi:hypothetical protein